MANIGAADTENTTSSSPHHESQHAPSHNDNLNNGPFITEASSPQQTQHPVIYSPSSYSQTSGSTTSIESAQNNLQTTSSKHAGFTEYRYLEWDTPHTEILALSSPIDPSTDESIDPSTEKPTTNNLTTSLSRRLSRRQPPPTVIPPAFLKIQDPFTWNRTRKIIVVSICCYSTITAAWASAGYAMGVPGMVNEWNVSKLTVMLGLPLFTIGFSLTPMVMSPLSEVYGRRNVLIVSQFVQVLLQMGCGLVRGPGANLALRILLGAAASPSSSLVAGMVADCHHSAERTLPMAFFTSLGLAATGLGPLISGYAAQYLGWRWISWIQLIINGCGAFFIFLFMRETRGCVLLSRKAKILNKWMDENEAGRDVAVKIRWRTRAEETNQTLSQMIRVSLTRPLYFLMTESVVFWFSIWVSFVWCCLYLFLSSIPYVFTLKKGFTPSHTGQMFLSLVIGAFVAQGLTQLTEYLLSKSAFISSRNGTLTTKTGQQHQQQHNPESRLYASCLYAPLLPIGIIMFGFTALTQPVYIPGIAMGLMTMGIFTVYLAVFNYLADTYHKYASSALAAQSMCRNLLGGFFPLVGEKIYDSIGVRNGSCVIAGVGVGLCVVPWVLVLFGEKIRARSKFCSEMEVKGEEADS